MTHMIMEWNSTSAKWRPRKTSGIIQSKGLRIREADGSNPVRWLKSRPRAEDEMRCPS